MNPHKVKTWEEVQDWLKAKGFTRTENTVDGGRYWRSKNGRHIIVTDPTDGFYPDFIWADLVKRIDKIMA